MNYTVVIIFEFHGPDRGSRNYGQTFIGVWRKFEQMHASLSVPLSILLYPLLMKHTDVQRNAFSVCSRMALRHHRDVRSVVLFGRFLHRVKRSSVAGHAFNQPLSEMFERIQEGRDGQGFREHEQSLNKRRLVLMMINTRGNNDAHRCIYQY